MQRTLIEQMKHERDKGYSFAAIAQKHQIPESTVRYQLKKNEQENQD